MLSICFFQGWSSFTTGASKFASAAKEGVSVNYRAEVISLKISNSFLLENQLLQAEVLICIQ